MSSTEDRRVKATTSTNIQELVASFGLTCEQNGVSPKQLFNQLLDELGFESTGVIRCKKIQKLELTDNIISYLQQIEKKKALEIADANVEYKARKPKKILSPVDGNLHYPPTSVDMNQAKFLLTAALMCFECRRDGKRLKKKDIMNCLGYKERTISFQEAKCKPLLDKSSDIIHIVYSAIKSEIIKKIGQ